MHGTIYSTTDDINLPLGTVSSLDIAIMHNLEEELHSKSPNLTELHWSEVASII